MSRYDLAIVGGGTAGRIASEIAAGLGARVALVERARTGGDCLWTGCVPSKSLIAAADLAHRIRTADAVGLKPHEPDIDFASVMAHVHGAQQTIAPDDSPERLRGLGVDVIEEEARFVSPRRLSLNGQNGRTIDFPVAIVSTGSRPIVPPLEGLREADPLTNETVWDLTELPRRLVIMGGGPIGSELGQAFRRLGSEVTIVQRADSLLTKEEPEARGLILDRFRSEGIDVRLNTKALRVEHGRRARGLVVEHDGCEEKLEFDRILVAAGRKPDTESLDLAAAGVETDRRGAVVVDDCLRSTAKGIYAAGDAAGQLPFTHVAAYHARLATPNALFHTRRKVSYDAVPWTTFTYPEVGRVGKTEADARKAWGEDVIVETHHYSHNDRAITAGEAHGFAKLVADPKGRLVGATVAAPTGGEAIAELAAWIADKGKIDNVSRTVHAYPTFAEGQARAADEYLRSKLFNDRVRRFTRPALRVLSLIERPRRVEAGR